MNPTVSIVVPVYNAAAYIEDTIGLVRRQTFSDWELILVNDASTDDSAARIRAVMQSLGEVSVHEESDRSVACVEAGTARILLIDKKKNEGAAAARNDGMAAMCGRYLAFLDADDLWYPDKLTRQLSFLREQNAIFTFTAYEFGDEAARPTGRIVHAPERLDLRHALSRTVIFTSTVMIDTERIDRALLHMPSIASEDTAMWWTILKSGIPACGLDEVLTVYRRPAGASLSSNKLVALKRIWDLYRKIAGLSVPASAWYFCGWAVRATLRRL